ncbi:disulfide bond formation protein B [Piscinibacterium candidicorallinum]|jgi:disulfide bond formation protein DsbB|uniref:Disulfide bond formation protein B n=1 Tax=Piscinibacterium candidicorallinum TaxID=1793872 RepID=A0ABV7H801_9BURK
MRPAYLARPDVVVPLWVRLRVPLITLCLLACIAALASAVILQKAWNLYPCPLCILQRYAFIALAAACVLALFWRPATWLAGLAALSGLGVAGFHLYRLAVPSEACGRDAVEAFVNGLPMAQWAPSWFAATGLCSDPIPPVLGISFPGWAFILFLLCGAALAVAAKAPRDE